MGNVCATCGFEAKEHSYNGACYGICGKFVERASSPVLVVEAGSPGISRYMSRIMSNLDGEKDAKISHLQSRVDELETALKGLLRVCPPERGGMKLREYEAARAALARKGYALSSHNHNHEAK